MSSKNIIILVMVAVIVIAAGLVIVNGLDDKEGGSGQPEDIEVTPITPEGGDSDSDNEYDTSVNHDATKLSDGDSLVGGTYTSKEKDISAIEASDKIKASITGAVINKTSGEASSADDSSFKGVNSAVRVYGEAEVSIKDCQISATPKNATGVFAYGGTIYISDSTVTVTGGGAGGIQVAGGGTLYADNLVVTSASKAAIRSDRGGGTMVVNGGTYTSTGSDGCPAIYSTANVTVSDATCVSENSRAVIIEGKNSVTLNNCVLTGNDQSSKSGSVRANVLLYQSYSGDASVGTSVFTMSAGKMISNSGAMFYCTNTSSIINLTGAELVLCDDSLLIVSEGRWGKSGSNGGDCVLNATDQTLSGKITVDGSSSLEINLKGSSIYAGCVVSDGTTDVYIESGSKWVLTGDSHISSLSCDGVIDLNGYTLYVDGKPYSLEEL